MKSKDIQINANWGHTVFFYAKKEKKSGYKRYVQKFILLKNITCLILFFMILSNLNKVISKFIYLWKHQKEKPTEHFEKLNKRLYINFV